MSDACRIENSFGYFFESSRESRGGPYDADVFRGGRKKDLGELLYKFACHFEVRLRRINLKSATQNERNVVKITIEESIRSLKHQSTQLKQMQDTEPEDYHWEIIGNMVSSIAALLDLLETKG